MKYIGIMKDIRIVLATLILAIPVVSGCEKEQKDDMGSGYTDMFEVKLTASTENLFPAETKSILDDMSILWERKDAFSLFGTETGNIKMSREGFLRDAVGEFSGKTATALPEKDTYHAFYPYADSVSFTSDGIEGIFPAEQSYDRLSAVMVAKADNVSSDGIELSFRNVFALLNVPVTGNGEEIASVTFRGNNMETVAGRFSVSDFENPVPVFSGINKDIRMNLDVPEFLGPEPVVFSFAIPAVTFEKGVSVELETVSGEYMIKTFTGEGGEPLEVRRNMVYNMDTIEFEGAESEYEWSKGYLTVDENGYRFTDTDRDGGTESIGMYFMYNGEYAIDVNLFEIDTESITKLDSVMVWYYNSTEDIYESKKMQWSELPDTDAGDPCSRVKVQAGEYTWKMPTEEQWKSWAYKTTTYNACKAYNLMDESRSPAPYAIYDTDPSEEGENLMYIFETRYLTSDGGVTQGMLWSMMWVARESEEDELMMLQFKPSVASNTKNPEFKTGSQVVPNQARQIRCIRRVR